MAWWLHRWWNFVSRLGDYPGVNGRWIGALVIAATAVLVSATPAYAHNSFSSSTPKDKAVLDTAPAEVALKFLAKLSPTGTKVTLTGPAGVSVAAGPARFNGSTVFVPLAATTAGVYTASYEVASSDGHPIRGKITFTLTPIAVPPPPPTSAPPATEPLTPTAGTGSPPVPVARENPEPGGAAPWWPWLAAGVVVVAAAGAFIAWRRRAGGRASGPDPGP